MLVKNRKTGVVMKATPRLVAMAVRNAHFELIEDDDFVDLEDVKALLSREEGADEILKDLQALVNDKLSKRSRVTKADPPKEPKAKAKESGAKVAKEKEPEKETGGGDDFFEIEEMVKALQGGEKDKDHKDRLESVALETFGVNLDKRKSLKALKQEVLDLIAEHRGQ